MSRCHKIRIQPRWQIHRLFQNHTGFAGIGFGELQIKPPLKIPQSRKILIQTSPILRAKGFLQLAGFLLDSAEGALAHQHFGVRRKRGGIGILKTLPEKTLVESQR